MPGLYDTFALLWNNPGMKIVAFAAVLGVCAPLVAAGQTRPATPRRQTAPAAPADRTAEAYTEFLRAHMLADAGNVDEAIAAYRRAIMLDPASPTIPAELAEFYAGENRAAEAQAAAEQSLQLDADNKQAHRVLGQIFAGIAGNAQDTRAGRALQQDNVLKAIEHFEKALENPVKATDIDVRALLGRL
jgi:tetratricopeptide (TPR) repeat protein